MTNTNLNATHDTTNSTSFFVDIGRNFDRSFRGPIPTISFDGGRTQQPNYTKINSGLHKAECVGGPGKNNFVSMQKLIGAAAELDSSFKAKTPFELLSQIKNLGIKLQEDVTNSFTPANVYLPCLAGFGNVYIQVDNNTEAGMNDIKIILTSSDSEKRVYEGIITDANELVQAREILTQLAA